MSRMVTVGTAAVLFMAGLEIDFGLIRGRLLLFLGLVAVAVAVSMGVRPPRVLMALERTLHASTQLPVLLVLVIVAVFVALADNWGLEGILGAFAAGIIVGPSTCDQGAELLRHKLDALIFGFLTPFFGATVALYWRDLPKHERLPFALSLPAASLGIVVVVTQIGTRTQGMNPDIAQALIGAAVLSVVVYPTLASLLSGAIPAGVGCRLEVA